MWLYCLHEVGRCDRTGYCREEHSEIQHGNGLNMVPPCFGVHGCAENCQSILLCLPVASSLHGYERVGDEVQEHLSCVSDKQQERAQFRVAKGRAQSKQKIGHLIVLGVTQCALQQINPIRGSSSLDTPALLCCPTDRLFSLVFSNLLFFLPDPLSQALQPPELGLCWAARAEPRAGLGWAGVTAELRRRRSRSRTGGAPGMPGARGRAGQGRGCPKPRGGPGEPRQQERARRGDPDSPRLRLPLPAAPGEFQLCR